MIVVETQYPNSKTRFYCLYSSIVKYVGTHEPQNRHAQAQVLILLWSIRRRHRSLHCYIIALVSLYISIYNHYAVQKSHPSPWKSIRVMWWLCDILYWATLSSRRILHHAIGSSSMWVTNGEHPSTILFMMTMYLAPSWPISIHHSVVCNKLSLAWCRNWQRTPTDEVFM